MLVGTWRNTGCSVLTRVLRKLSRVSLLPPYFLRGAYSFLPAGKLSLAPLHPNFVSCHVVSWFRRSVGVIAVLESRALHVVRRSKSLCGAVCRKSMNPWVQGGVSTKYIGRRSSFSLVVRFPPRAAVSCFSGGVDSIAQVDQGMDASMAIEPMAGGVLIGMTTMMCFLSLMTAVYWGQMSG